MIRSCKKCNTSKDITEFRKAKGCDFGYTHVCKTCSNLRSLSRYKSVGQRKRKLETNRDRHLRIKYGITDVDYVNMFNEQKGVCPVCTEVLELRDSSTHIDHNHTTGKVRGLLHISCNLSLGLIKENFDTALRLAKYIQTHERVL